MRMWLYKFISLFLPSCRDVAHLASENCERTLTFRERWGIKFKNMICVYTDRYVKQIAILNKELGKLDESSFGENIKGNLSDECKKRLKAKMSEQ